MSTLNELITAIVNRSNETETINDDIEFLHKQVDKFQQYFNSVYDRTYGSSAAKTLVRDNRISADEYKVYESNLSTNQNAAYESVLNACERINRMCDMYSIEHLCPDINRNEDNKEKIDIFVLEYMDNMFKRGLGNEMTAPIEMN